MSSGDNRNIQIVTNRIRPNKPFDRIMFQTVRHSGDIPVRVLQNRQFLGKCQPTTKNKQTNKASKQLQLNKDKQTWYVPHL